MIFSFSKVVCVACRTALYSHMAHQRCKEGITPCNGCKKSDNLDPEKCSVPRALDVCSSGYNNTLPHATRAAEQDACSCRLCTYARKNGVVRKREAIKIRIEKNNNEYQLDKQQETLAEEKTVSKKEKRKVEIESVCKRCKQVLQRGINHNCLKSSKIQNLMSLAGNDLERVIQKSVQKKSKTMDEILIYGEGRGPLKLKKNQMKEKKSKLVPIELVRKLKAIGLSDRQLLKNLMVMKCKLPYVKKLLAEEKCSLDDFFTYEVTEVTKEFSKQSKKPEEIQNCPLVYCSNTQALVEKIIGARQLDKDNGLIKTKVLLDSGRDFLKLMVGICDLRQFDRPTLCEQKEQMQDKLKFLNTSSRRVQILGILPDVQENRNNCVLLINKCNINKMDDYIFVADHKAQSKVIGIGPHSSGWPCGYCRCKKSKVSGWLHPAPEPCTCLRRSLKSLDEQMTKRREINGYITDPTGTKTFSVIEPSAISNTNSNILIRQLVPPCELHLVLGANEVLQHLACEMEDGALTDFLLLELNLEYEPYHGGQSLEGKGVRKIFKNLNLLSEVLEDQPGLFPFLSFLAAYAAVTESCFGIWRGEDWREDLEHFSFALSFLQESFPRVGETVKWHVIRVHVGEWLGENCGRGLGQISEQEGEDCHGYWLEFWRKYKVKSKQNPRFVINMFRAVTDHNSNNIGWKI